MAVSKDTFMKIRLENVFSDCNELTGDRAKRGFRERGVKIHPDWGKTVGRVPTVNTETYSDW